MDDSVSPPGRISSALLWSTIGGFLLIALLVYGESLKNEFVRWDDGLLVYENPMIRAINWETLTYIFTHYDPELYIPFTFLSYQLDFFLGGIKPTIYHMQNLLWHTANALLVTWFILLLMKNRWLAVVGGLIFLLHPLHTEAVAWASARKDVLSCFFFLWSLIGYIRYRNEGSRKWLYVSLVTFAFALLSKVTVITLPAILFLLDFYEKRSRKEMLSMEKIPYFLLSIIFAIIAFFGKTGVISSSTWWEKILISPVSAVFYLEKLLLPIRLGVLYPFTQDLSVLNLRVILSVSTLTILCGLVLWSLKYTRAYFTGFVFFLIAVAPTLPNFAKGDFFYFASDRYAYIGSIGILLIFCAVLAKILENKNDRILKIGTGGISILLITLAVMAHIQSRTWKTSETLFLNVLKNYPTAAAAENNLGNYYTVNKQQENPDKAIQTYEHALSLMREYGRATGASQSGESKIVSNLASAHRQSGNPARSYELYREALKLNPINTHALLGLGILHMSRSEPALAEDYYMLALNVDDQFVTALINLGSLYSQTGRPEEAEQILQRAVQTNPYYPQAYYNLGVVLRSLSRNREALEVYEKAVELAPSFTAARINLGILYAERKKKDEAIEQFQEVLKYDPNNERAKSALLQLGAK